MMEGPKKKDGLEKNPKGKPSRGAAAGIYNPKGEKKNLAPKGDSQERSAFADPESEEEFDFEEAAANHDAMMEGPKKKDGLEKNPKGKPSRGAAAGIYNPKGLEKNPKGKPSRGA